MLPHKELNNNLLANNVPFKFAYDSTSQKYGYKIPVGGADTFIPFNKKPLISGMQGVYHTPGNVTSNVTETLAVDIEYALIFLLAYDGDWWDVNFVSADFEYEPIFYNRVASTNGYSIRVIAAKNIHVGDTFTMNGRYGYSWLVAETSEYINDITLAQYVDAYTGSTSPNTYTISSPIEKGFCIAEEHANATNMNFLGIRSATFNIKQTSPVGYRTIGTYCVNNVKANDTFTESHNYRGVYFFFEVN